MLIYIIVSCIMSLCYSIRNPGDYGELIFVQRSPATAYFAYKNKLQNEGTSSEEVIAYLMDYWMILNPPIWNVHQLRPIESSCGSIFGCATFRYHEAIPHENFRRELRRKWPSFFMNRTEDDMWELHFNAYGSCVKPTPFEYFEFAINLLDEHNIGRILGRAGIHPGTNYTLDRITRSITNSLRIQPYVRCLPAPHPDEQYLLEIQICYNRAHHLIDCHCPVDDLCHINKTVIYPGWPVH